MIHEAARLEISRESAACACRNGLCPQQRDHQHREMAADADQAILGRPRARERSVVQSADAIENLRGGAKLPLLAALWRR
jgi:hypothetical protein